MNTPIYYTEEDLTFIKANCHLYTMQEMAIHLAIGKKVLENMKYRHKLTFKEPQRDELGKKLRVRDGKNERPDKKVPLVRPVAAYSNTSAYGNHYE